MHKLLIAGLIVCAVLFGSAQLSRAHVEQVELAMDIIADRDHATGELRVSIVDLMLSELPPGETALPNPNRDPMEVAKKHADEMLKAFKINYDITPMKGRLKSVEVRSLVIGVNGEDIIPRSCGVFTMEFTNDQPLPAPGKIVVRHTLFKQPDDAGFQPTVACLISFRQVNQTSTRNDVIGIDDTLTLKCQWPSELLKAKASQAIALPLAQTAPANPPARPPIDEQIDRPQSPAVLLMLGVIGVGIIVMAIVLAKKKTL